MIRGVDVSLYQPAPDWAALAAAGFEFFYARALDGTAPDKTHDIHIVKGRAAGLVGGSYQFGHPSMDVDACADAFLARASLVKRQLRPVIDMETLARGTDGQLHVPDNAAAWADAWCERVKTRLLALFPDSFGARRGPMAYASTSYWNTMVAMRPSLGGLFGWDLWDAEYHADGDAHAPHVSCVAWQYAGNVPLAGQVGLWDLDETPDLDRLRL